MLVGSCFPKRIEKVPPALTQHFAKSEFISHVLCLVIVVCSWLVCSAFSFSINPKLVHQHINSTEMQQPEPTDAGEGGRGGMLPHWTAPITTGLHTVGTIPWNNNNHNLPKCLSLPHTHPSPSRRCLPSLHGDGASACGRSCCFCLSHDRSSVQEGCVAGNVQMDLIKHFTWDGQYWSKLGVK